MATIYEEAAQTIIDADRAGCALPDLDTDILAPFHEIRAKLEQLIANSAEAADVL